MSSAAHSIVLTISETSDGFALSGHATTTGISAALEQVMPHQYVKALHNREVILDFSAVNDVDSAALALVFEWQRALAQQGCRLRCLHLPSPMLAFANLYGVADFVSP